MVDSRTRPRPRHRGRRHKACMMNSTRDVLSQGLIRVEHAPAARRRRPRDRDRSRSGQIIGRGAGRHSVRPRHRPGTRPSSGGSPGTADRVAPRPPTASGHRNHRLLSGRPGSTLPLGLWREVPAILVRLRRNSPKSVPPRRGPGGLEATNRHNLFGDRGIRQVHERLGSIRKTRRPRRGPGDSRRPRRGVPPSPPSLRLETRGPRPIAGRILGTGAHPNPRADPQAADGRDHSCGRRGTIGHAAFNSPSAASSDSLPA